MHFRCFVFVRCRLFLQRLAASGSHWNRIDTTIMALAFICFDYLLSQRLDISMCIPLSCKWLWHHHFLRFCFASIWAPISRQFCFSPFDRFSFRANLFRFDFLGRNGTIDISHMRVNRKNERNQKMCCANWNHMLKQHFVLSSIVWFRRKNYVRQNDALSMVMLS